MGLSLKKYFQNIGNKWESLIGEEFQKSYFDELIRFLEQEHLAGQIIYPSGENIFKAFEIIPPDQIKVVILGQDPYHGQSQAHGLCFSVQEDSTAPPSLVNIFKEIKSDTGVRPHTKGNLTNWAKQGVFLLNTVLTVRSGQPASHRDKGWEIFTDAVIRELSQSQPQLVFLLWGSFAISKKKLIAPNQGHLILEAPHPSPLSAYRGFMGCRHFSKTNDFLKQIGKSEIIW